MSDRPDARIHILSVAYPLLPVTPGSGGGAEQILRLLEAGIVEAGFQSSLIAADGSEIQGTLLATEAATDDAISPTDQARVRRAHQERIEQALREDKFDLIHYHGVDFLDYRPRENTVPELATLHLPVSWYPAGLFETEEIHFNFVSESQASIAKNNRPIAVIPNGVELAKYHVAKNKSDYLLWLGRICPEKATHIALSVAHTLQIPLLIAGPVHAFPAHRAYFDSQVSPKLDTMRRYLGSVDSTEKARLLSEARCLLVPSLAPETSSLVAMEAISSGTPVIAFRSGALPEVVEHGVTGFVVDSEDEMAQAVSAVDPLNPAVMRARAEARFSSERMIEAYLELYRRIIHSPRAE